MPPRCRDNAAGLKRKESKESSASEQLAAERAEDSRCGPGQLRGAQFGMPAGVCYRYLRLGKAASGCLTSPLGLILPTPPRKVPAGTSRGSAAASRTGGRGSRASVGAFRVPDAAPERGALTPREPAARGAPQGLAARRRGAPQPVVAYGGCRRGAGAVARSTPKSGGADQGRGPPANWGAPSQTPAAQAAELFKHIPLSLRGGRAAAGHAPVRLRP